MPLTALLPRAQSLKVHGPRPALPTQIYWGGGSAYYATSGVDWNDLVQVGALVAGWPGCSLA